MLNSVGLQGPGVDAWLGDELPALERAGARVVAQHLGPHGRRLRGARPTLLADAPPQRRRGRGQPVVPEPRGRRASVRPLARRPRPRRSRRPRRCERPASGRSSARTSPTSSRSRAPRATAGADAVTLVNTVMGLAIDAEHRPPALGAGGGGLSGRAIHPSRCARSTTCTPRCPTCRSSASAACATGSRRGRAAAGRGVARCRSGRRPSPTRARRCGVLRRAATTGAPPRRRARRRLIGERAHDDRRDRDRSTSRAADRLALALDVDDLVDGDAPRPQAAAVVRRREGRARALQRRRARRHRRVRRPRLRRVRRPEAARHPDDGGPAPRACSARSASTTSPSTRRAAWRCCAPASRASPRAPSARACPTPIALAVTVLTSDGDAPPHILAEAGRRRGRERLRRHRVRGDRRARGRAVRAALHDRRARHPAGGRRRTTTRPAPRRPGRRSRPAPTCS